MAKRLRWLRSEAAYCEVQRTVDRQFFFVPNKTIRNIIGASVGRAQRKYPVKLYWIDFNINHKQSGRAALSESPEHIENLVRIVIQVYFAAKFCQASMLFNQMYQGFNRILIGLYRSEMGQIEGRWPQFH